MYIILVREPFHTDLSSHLCSPFCVQVDVYADLHVNMSSFALFLSVIIIVQFLFRGSFPLIGSILYKTVNEISPLPFSESRVEEVFVSDGEEVSTTSVLAIYYNHTLVPFTLGLLCVKYATSCTAKANGLLHVYAKEQVDFHTLVYQDIAQMYCGDHFRSIIVSLFTCFSHLVDLTKHYW